MSLSNEITRLQTAKSDLKTAIENKGVTVPSATKLDGYASLVDDIETMTVDPISITSNGTYSAPSGHAYSPVTVSVPTFTPTIQSLSVTENGTYTAPSGVDGYSPVSVNVPGIVPTGSQTFTENGTYDVTSIAEAVIDVAGGGSSWKKLASKTYTFTEEPPTARTQIDSFQLDPNDIYVGDRLIYSIFRRKNFSGQASCYVGCDWFFFNINPYKHTTVTLTVADRGGRTYYTNNTGVLMCTFAGANNSTGVSVTTISSDGTVAVEARYIQSLGSLIGEYSLDIYSLEWPDNLEPFSTT